MSARLGVRLLLDLSAALLLIAGLAYWWLDNVAHELIGTGMFLLVFSHNFFNRRWYGRIPKSITHTRGRVVTALNLTFLVVMVTLLVSSLVISRVLFEFVPIGAGRFVRDLHVVAAYWAILLVGVHLGLNWPVVLTAFRAQLRLGAPDPIRTLLARFLAAVIAIIGVRAVLEMGFGAKLINHVTLDMWDFNARTPAFFMNYLAIIGLCATVSYYASRISWRGRKAARTNALKSTKQEYAACEDTL